MACLHTVTYMEDYEEDEGDKPEFKHWFGDGTLDVYKDGPTREVTGYRPWFSTVPFRGSDDKRVQGPAYNDEGRPVLGNYLRPIKFCLKATFKTGVKSVTVPPASGFPGTVTNSISFRLICMLVWLYPPTSTNQDDELEFFENFFMTYAGMLKTQAFLKPEVKEQVMILYDAIHTLSSPKAPLRGVYGDVSAAAGGQAGYIVPAPSGTVGWVVPAATVPAISTTKTAELRDVYGGHIAEVIECIDLQGIGISTWRDPLGEEENQMVPYMQVFIVTDDVTAYPSPSLSRTWNMNAILQSCMYFTDE